MSETALEIQTNKTSDKLATEFTQYSSAEIAIIKDQVCKGATGMELGYVLQLAKSYNLNPFKKEIWAYKDGRGNLVTFVGVNGLIKLASERPEYGGVYASSVYSKDEIEIDIANGVINHKFNPASDRGELLGAWARIKRTDNQPDEVSWVKLGHYKKNSPTWTAMPDAMIEKVAKATVLRPFANASNLYIEEEFDVRNGVIVQENNKNLELQNDFA